MSIRNRAVSFYLRYSARRERIQLLSVYQPSTERSRFQVNHEIVALPSTSDIIHHVNIFDRGYVYGINMSFEILDVIVNFFIVSGAPAKVNLPLRYPLPYDT